MPYIHHTHNTHFPTRPTIPTNCPPAYAELMKACWQPNPDARPPFKKIVECVTQMMKENLLDYLGVPEEVASPKATTEKDPSKAEGGTVPRRKASEPSSSTPKTAPTSPGGKGTGVGAIEAPPAKPKPLSARPAVRGGQTVLDLLGRSEQQPSGALSPTSVEDKPRGNYSPTSLPCPTSFCKSDTSVSPFQLETVD